MDITLNQTEITKALDQYIAGLGVNLEDKATNVVFTAGRGDNGYTATIAITEPVAEKAKKTTKTRGPNKPKVVAKASPELSADGAEVLNKLGLASLDPNADKESPEDTTPADEKSDGPDESPFEGDTSGQDTKADEPNVVADAQPANTEEAAPTGQSSLFGN